MAGFALNISRYANSINQSVERTAKAIKIELFSSVIQDTRVDTGRLRGNWQCGHGAAITTVVEGEATGPDSFGRNASVTLAEMQAVVKPNGVDILTNNLDYAEHWEEVDGMIAKNMARIGRIVSGAA